MSAVREVVARVGFPRGRSTPDLGVGLEPEMFPLRVGADGAILGRMPLEGADSVLEVFDELAEREAWLLPRDPEAGAPRFELAHGGSYTFEPGAQVEHSTAVHKTAHAALTDLARHREVLCGAFRARGVRLAKCGYDVFEPVEAVPQQLRAPRYPAMASYFASRSSEGRIMMRHTATLQVNLDLGAEGVDLERWLLSNLSSPFATASFASSPRGEAVCGRSQAWQALDPTRSGFPRGLLEGRIDDPVGVLTEAALEADVLLFRKPGGGAEPGTPGFSFGQWLREGHPDHGSPSVDDLEYHLTTLFFEVRCRGFFELRACDNLPEPWDVAPVVFFCGLLYEDEARKAAIDLLGDLRPELDALWRQAGRTGLREGVLAERSHDLWRIALAGARRLPAGYFEPQEVAHAEQFVERFVAQGRSPSDELRAALEQGESAALAWAMGDAPCPDSKQPCPDSPPTGRALA